jgi:hypothetical protein
MQWKKKGLLYCHKNDNGDDAYTTVPFVHYLRDDIFRLFFSARDAEGKSFPLYVDVDIFTGSIVDTAVAALISKGNLGAFDDAGCILFQVLVHNNINYLYYAGWSLSKHVPFKCFIGLATSSKSIAAFSKYSEAPILNSNPHNPYITGSPFIIIENDVWRMWYLSGTKWATAENTAKHYYTITYAESYDGINWQPSGKICIPFKSDKEYAIARPHVIKHNGIYKMWYSYREDDTCVTYQIGYAESNDGIDWVRKDEEAGIAASNEGWDSEMICYPFVFEHKQKFYMLYNGNAYGKTGVGLAELVNW